jgi:hypothetical protein
MFCFRVGLLFGINCCPFVYIMEMPSMWVRADLRFTVNSYHLFIQENRYHMVASEQLAVLWNKGAP